MEFASICCIKGVGEQMYTPLKFEKLEALVLQFLVHFFVKGGVFEN